MQLKRLWDTEGKKIVFAEGPSGHMCQVWTDETGDHLYIYDMAQWLSYNGTSPAGMEYDRSNWVELVDQEVGFYDTNEPTDLYAWDSGDKASYKFVDWDGTVLKSGVVEEGETPTAPADPTRPATAQYTYTFTGWNPTVGPISKRTVYTATYTATVNKYTVTIEVNSSDYGYTEPGEITNVPYGTTVTENADHSLSIGTVTVTPHANTGYYFSSWEEIPETIEDDTTLTAQFNIEDYTISIASEDVTKGTVDVASETADYGTTISAVDNVLTIGYTDITATPETGYEFSAWTDENGDPLPETVTGALSIVAKFVEE